MSDTEVELFVNELKCFGIHHLKVDVGMLGARLFYCGRRISNSEPVPPLETTNPSSPQPTMIVASSRNPGTVGAV